MRIAVHVARTHTHTVYDMNLSVSNVYKFGRLVLFVCFARLYVGWCACLIIDWVAGWLVDLLTDYVCTERYVWIQSSKYEEDTVSLIDLFSFVHFLLEEREREKFRFSINVFYFRCATHTSAHTHTQMHYTFDDMHIIFFSAITVTIAAVARIMLFNLLANTFSKFLDSMCSLLKNSDTVFFLSQLNWVRTKIFFNSAAVKYFTIYFVQSLIVDETCVKIFKIVSFLHSWQFFSVFRNNATYCT